MESFFDFDTTLNSVQISSVRNHGKLKNKESEDEYDALNDETFGDPEKGDWEDMHETLVRLEKGDDFIFKDKDELFDDGELDLHLSRFDFGDEDESVSSVADMSFEEDITSKLDPSIWDSPLKNLPIDSFGIKNLFPNLSFRSTQNGSESVRNNHIVVPQVPPKMVSVEDLERNMIQQQQEQMRKECQRQQSKLSTENKKSKEIRKLLPIPSIPSLVSPAQLLAIRGQLFPPPPLLNHASRLPIGFLPYNYIPTHYTAPLNNLAMHPGFPGRIGHQVGLFAQQRLPLPVQPNLIPNIPSNQFNKRLVQEIQQNHPMLSFHRQNQQHTQLKQAYHQRHKNQPRGPDFDDYANMMSNREKQWLLNIQLTQLNSDTPYINDYYFTVYKERLNGQKGNDASKAYKANWLNHPFTQPKGHTQLLVRTLGMANTKGVSPNFHRERKSSESLKNNNEMKDPPIRAYTPLQFENSLGKLQCGSVTAPRKIIDMEVVNNEQTSSGNINLELSMHRKSRHILLSIENLFKIVLKIEDLNNPVAMEAILIAKEKREHECQVQASNSNSMNLKSLSTTLDTEFDTVDQLTSQIIANLTPEKVIPMLNVRKGKVLLRRISVLLRNDPHRWTLWSSIFSAIPFMLKKDRDDQEGVFFALYTEFERHVQYSKFSELLKLSQAIAVDKIVQFLTSCKFLLSSVITVIFQMEIFFENRDEETVGFNEQTRWIAALQCITDAISTLLSSRSNPVSSKPWHTIKIDPENSIIQTVQKHLERFPEQVNGSVFLDFITEESTVTKKENEDKTN
ncbi:protein PAT1 homolog 1-like [Uranotaenia lowii]|uniref:protein PAT1 homolog 1-like n=1 Tax=Uranotaenia lowii TaxID=190385 RepID=UPI002478628A|nr:protein PAT1 homolog 1-like [Uranotaenia lowii]